MVLRKHREQHTVAERLKWKKYGAAAKSGLSADEGSTTLAEEVSLKLAANKNFDLEEQATSAAENTKKIANSNITCRVCKGDHWTSRCPYKDTLAPLDDILAGGDGTKPAATDDVEPTPAEAAAAASVKPKPGKYVPPSQRGGATSMGAGAAVLDSEAARRKLEDACTVRVSNLSEDAEEEDVRALFSRFGQLARCFVARHHDSGVCKGYSFVCFKDKSDAARAISAMNGYGFDNLILNVEWAKPQ